MCGVGICKFTRYSNNNNNNNNNIKTLQCYAAVCIFCGPSPNKNSILCVLTPTFPQQAFDNCVPKPEKGT